MKNSYKEYNFLFIPVHLSSSINMTLNLVGLSIRNGFKKTVIS